MESNSKVELYPEFFKWLNIEYSPIHQDIDVKRISWRFRSPSSSEPWLFQINLSNGVYEIRKIIDQGSICALRTSDFERVEKYFMDYFKFINDNWFPDMLPVETLKETIDKLSRITQ